MICTFLLLAVIRPSNIEAFIENTDIAWVLEETGVQNQINEALTNFPAHTADTHVRASEIEAFLQSENVTGEMATVFSGFVYAFVEGNLDHHVTSGEIVAIARNLEPEIQNHFGYTMTEEDFRILQTTLDHVDLETLSVGRIIEETDINPNLMSTAFSIYPMLITGTLSILSLLSIFAVNGRNIPKALRVTGVTLLLPGLLFVPLGLMFLASPGVFSGGMYVAARAIGGPVTLLVQYGLICGIIGIGLVVASGVVRATRRREEYVR